MPKRTDINSILILGAGPIVIGQACEFDYSGTQSCRALKEEGYRVILVNSNPATIMTDPQMADATYIEPVRWEVVAKIIEKEKPDAILPTMGGQTALNCTLDLAREGILKKFNVEMIGATRKAIDKAEDREKFNETMKKIGLEVPHSRLAHNLQDAEEALKEIGFPAIIRPSFTLGGSGGGIAYNRAEFAEICENGFDQSPTHEVLIDESIIGWKEYEMEVIRDKEDNCIIVCSIENVDPMGIHTGDSITVAPAQTLTDKEYQRMRDASIAVLREIGIETGGSNVQFAVNPKDGRMVVIEMNPRVSRSSALASKATGFPIAKVATKLAIGYTLNELKNEITDGQTPASFEPAIDYVVTKIPRFNFEKFPRSVPRLTTQMKSVGEVMAIGRSFQESLQKALRGLEIDVDGLDPLIDLETPNIFDTINYELRMPGAERLWHIANAFRLNLSLEEIHKLTQIDSWFLIQIEDLVKTEKNLDGKSLQNLNKTELYHLKRKGFSDRRLAALLKTTEQTVRNYRHSLNIRPVYKRVDTCAAEFSTTTSFLYSTYEEECEAMPTNRKKIMVLGSGPNRIGQGIEFDYCCVHAAIAMRESGYETIMVNCNPETVSTDFDISDRLYFEPLTLEDVLELIDLEKPQGVIVQYGGQTPLKLARALHAANVPIIGTSTDAIDRAEDRERCQKLIQKLDLLQPPNGTIRSVEEGLRLADVFAYPLIVRPSYVLGGRAMEVIPNAKELRRYMNEAPTISPEKPLLLDYFIDNATEIDIDAVCDGEQVIICGIMEHVEPAGVHSGDSACCFPANTLSDVIQNEIKDKIKQIAVELGVIGLINAQFAICNDNIYLLEINPRASRTIPFISKATGVSWAKIASRCMVGETLAAQNCTSEIIPKLYFIKESVLPFHRFPGAIPLLGPEMKSTGEVMGIGKTFDEAYAKAQFGAGFKMARVPRSYILINVLDISKAEIEQLKKIISKTGYKILAPPNLSDRLNEYHIPFTQTDQLCGTQFNLINLLKSGKIQLIIHIDSNKQLSTSTLKLLESAIHFKVLYTTTFRGTLALLSALSQKDLTNIRCLQEINVTT